MSSSLSKRWVCCVVETYLSFSLWIASSSLLLVIRVHIVWMKGKKVILKILQAESLTGTSRDGLFCKVLTKYNLALNSSPSNMCFSHALFARTFLVNFLWASHETTLIFISCSILYQLNIKLNTIKSHKI